MGGWASNSNIRFWVRYARRPNGVLRGFYWAGYHYGAALCRLVEPDDIVMAQQTVWFAIPLFPMFVIFLFPPGRNQSPAF